MLTHIVLFTNTTHAYCVVIETTDTALSMLHLLYEVKHRKLSWIIPLPRMTAGRSTEEHKEMFEKFRSVCNGEATAENLFEGLETIHCMMEVIECLAKLRS